MGTGACEESVEVLERDLFLVTTPLPERVNFVFVDLHVEVQDEEVPRLRVVWQVHRDGVLAGVVGTSPDQERWCFGVNSAV